MYLLRVEINGHIYPAAPKQVSAVVTPAYACGGPARQICSTTELILTALPALWRGSPRSSGADRPSPAAQYLGLGLLVTALAQLHVRNLAQRSDSIRFAVSWFLRVSTYCTKIRSGPMAVLYWLRCSRGKAGTTQAVTRS
jgi:hypothetical protein